ncbi:MAG TPA: deoxyribonuclease IV [Chloroflexia bacterium]|nr:deoxyribonuclease IV [Chloroflexia bacterium]
MKLGAHMSIAGGYYKALELGQKNCCTVVQLFTKNASQWAGKPLTDDDSRLFMEFRDSVPFANTDLVAHDSYLINLASPDDVLWEKSIEAFAHELDRCEALGIPNLVTHAGAHMGSGEERGLERIASAIERVVGTRPEQDVMVLLETTAGQGTSLCYAFEHLRDVRELLSPEVRARVGVCWDTCHLLAAGFDFGDEYKYERMVESFDRIVGLDTLRAIHMNDSKKGLGSRVDRHEHIGKGALGLEPFRFIMNDPRFENVPKILETPKEGDNGPDGKPVEMDPINLEALKSLVK